MAILVGIGLSTHYDPLQAAREAAVSAKRSLRSEKIDLGIVLSTPEFAHATVLKTINKLLGEVNLVGCSSFGLITNDGIIRRGLLVMLLSLPEGTYLNTAHVKDVSDKSATLAGQELADKLSYGFKNIRRNFSLIFSDGLIPNGFGLLNGLQERLGRSFPVAGASASDNLTFKKTFQYFNTEVLYDAACGILWGGRVNFGLGIQHGWKPLGKLRDVTKSSGNIVHEIDGVPAVNMYKEYFFSDTARLKKELKRISVLYPIGIYLPGEKEYLLRSLLSIEDSGSLVFQGNVPQDSQIRLMIGTKESCLTATLQALNQVKAGMANRPCDFIFVFDSVSRYKLLGRQAGKELDIIKARLGKDIPIVGLYTYGEQAPLQAIDYHGQAYFHNQTIAIVGIGG